MFYSLLIINKTSRSYNVSVNSKPDHPSPREKPRGNFFDINTSLQHQSSTRSQNFFVHTRVDKISCSQSASSFKVIQKSTFVLSRSVPIRHSERSVWASSLPDSFNNVMAVVKREISCLNLFRIVACTCLQYNMDG